MSIGKFIAQALKEAMENTKVDGPEIELNEAARASHEEHKAIIDELYPVFQEAELALTKAKNRLEEERQRWAISMRIAQPETAEGTGFSINDAGTHFVIHYDSKEERDAAVGELRQPEWVKEILGSKPN